MDLELEYESFNNLKKCQPVSFEQTAQGEYAVPEYMPEILRIIRSEAVPRIESCRTVGNRVTVDGVCEMRTVYTSEDGGVYTLTYSEPFTRHCENEVFDGSCDVTAKTSVNYVNCRATGTRRAEIKCGFAVSLTSWRTETEKVVSSGSCKRIEEQCIPVVVSSLGCRQTRRFAMSDTLTLTSPASFIVGARACSVCGETRKISNKVMIKGEAVVEIAYVPSADKTQVERIKHTLPVNQILEFDGMDEIYSGDVALECSACDVMLRSDGDGICRSADISLGIDATVTMWEKKELSLICDAYAVGASVELKKKRCALRSPVCELNETHVVNSVIQISGEGVSSVLDVTAEPAETTVSSKDGELVVSGSIKVALLIRDAKGSLSGFEKMVDYSFKKKTELVCESPQAYPAVTVVAADCSVNGESSVETRIEVIVTGTVFTEMFTEAVTDMKMSDAPFSRSKNAVTVYFPEKEESLWGIARRYSTTVSAIAAENEINGESTGDLKILFIPAV